MGQSVSEAAIHDILLDIGRLLGYLADLDRVVWTISWHKSSFLAQIIKVGFKCLISLKTVNFDGTWEHLLGIKLSTEHLWQHFVDSDVCQEKVVILEELSFV